MGRRFTDINEGFNCIHCGTAVLPSTRSCRNHCPSCFYSLHLDVSPGDRLSTCHGVMKPVRIHHHPKKGYQVVHECQKCGLQTKNVLRFEDDIQPDSFEKALELMSTLGKELRP